MKESAWIGRLNGDDESAVLAGLEFIGWESLIHADTRVFIKPNLTYPQFKQGATTRPEFIETVVKLLMTRTSHIAIGESDGGNNSYPAEVPFTGHDLYRIAEKYDVELINLSRDERRNIPVKTGIRTRSIPLSARMLDDFDVTINLPVPKMHFVVGYTGAVKNHWGLVPDTMRLRNHYFFSHAILEIIKRTSPEIVIADGAYFMDRNGPIRGDAVDIGLTVVAQSPGVADVILTNVMGLDPHDFIYLRHAIKKGFAPERVSDIEMNADPAEFRCRTFRLERSSMDRFATAGFYSKWMTKIVYDSPLAGPIHKIIRKARHTSDIESTRPAEDIRIRKCKEP